MLITTDEDYVVKTVSGIVSIHSGTTFNMKSLSSITILSETNIDIDANNGDIDINTPAGIIELN